MQSKNSEYGSPYLATCHVTFTLIPLTLNIFSIRDDQGCNDSLNSRFNSQLFFYKMRFKTNYKLNVSFLSRVRVHSWLPLLSVLSCLFQQFVAGAISTDLAVGLRLSQAASFTPVAHYPLLYIFSSD